MSERRRRDLNPRAAINDLHPFQGCPFSLLGTSAKYRCLNISYIIFNWQAFLPVQRRGWDSNPRALADKRFSRPPRYDHFDTSPCFAPQSVRDLFYHQNSSLSTIFFTFFDIFCFALKCFVIPGAVNKHWRSAGLLVL